MSDLEKITNQIRLATDYQINKRILREKVLTDLHVPYNNGLFKITPELMAFIATWPDATLYLEDTYENPIQIQREEFLKLCQQHYQQVMNTWHIQHEEIKRARKI